MGEFESNILIQNHLNQVIWTYRAYLFVSFIPTFFERHRITVPALKLSLCCWDINVVWCFVISGWGCGTWSWRLVLGKSNGSSQFYFQYRLEKFSQKTILETSIDFFCLLVVDKTIWISYFATNYNWCATALLPITLQNEHKHHGKL